jgi:hypothetical protein
VVAGGAAGTEPHLGGHGECAALEGDGSARARRAFGLDPGRRVRGPAPARRMVGDQRVLSDAMPRLLGGQNFALATGLLTGSKVFFLT